jgi:hypothetical protein
VGILFISYLIAEVIRMLYEEQIAGVDHKANCRIDNDISDKYLHALTIGNSRPEVKK